MSVTDFRCSSSMPNEYCQSLAKKALREYYYFFQPHCESGFSSYAKIKYRDQLEAKADVRLSSIVPNIEVNEKKTNIVPLIR